MNPETFPREVMEEIDNTSILSGPTRFQKLPWTEAAVGMVSPHQWVRVAQFIQAWLDREPLRSSPGYEAHRQILGTLQNELRSAARQAGEPDVPFRLIHGRRR
jgi:hypothetical protein